MAYTFPENPQPYTDKYFLRANEILKAEGLNPFVRAQVFIRKGPGKTAGLDEAVAWLDRFSPLKENGGRVLALPDSVSYTPKETQMVIEARIQDIMELETTYLGIISAATTLANGGGDVDLSKVEATMHAVVEAAQGRAVSYFGARHWRWDKDAEIAVAAFKGGATSTSTDVGAALIGQKGMGTIPHALENIYAWLSGKETAVLESTKAFDRVIAPEIPRIALIDYNNREIDDSLAVARELGDRLYAVRVDTCGENVMQGATLGDRKYWEGNGVSITGVAALRKALNDEGFGNTKIVLSSGFADVEKVKAFVAAEQQYGLKLFGALGVGGVYPSRMATMDIVAVGERLDAMEPMSKVGRTYQPNPRLETRLGR